MMTRFLVVGMASALFGCVDHNFSPPRDLKSYHPGYMSFATGLILMPVQSENHVLIEYDAQGRPTKRIGGILPLPGFVGFDGQFNSKIYEEVTYVGNRAVIEEKYAEPDMGFYAYRKEIFFDNGKIVRTIKHYWQNHRMHLDTTDFSYQERTITATSTRTYIKLDAALFSYSSRTDKVFKYSSGNLMAVETVLTGSLGYPTTITETFEDYDAAPNPTKRLIIFDNAFYRSLSKNNFRRYKYEEISYWGSRVERNTSWEFRYDENGHPTYRH